MSHYIEKTLDIEEEPIIKPLNKKIVVPRFSELKRTSHLSEG